MSSVWRSQGLVLATAMAVSGTVILLTLLKEKNGFLHTRIPGNPGPETRLRSCLSSGKKAAGKEKKRVRFADSVKDSKGNGKEYRKARREYLLSCGTQNMEGVINERVQLVEC